MMENGQVPCAGAPAPEIEKSHATLSAQFALAGHSFRIMRNLDGRTLYEVSRWGQARVFSHLHDVQAFLAAIGGAA